MNSKFGTFLTTLMILIGITLWSVSVLAADQDDAVAESRVETRQTGDDAHREAALDAVGRIKASAKLDLDIELAAHPSALATSN